MRSNGSLIGAAWLIWKTESTLQRKAMAWARWGLLWVGLGMLLVSLATPLVSKTVFAKWFDFPRTLGLMVLPALTLLAGWWIWIATRGGAVGKSGEKPGAAMPRKSADWAPLAGATVIFTIALLGLAYSLFPYVVIDRLTIWEAASHRSALVVVLVGFAAVLPFLVWYTIYAHRVFWGKVRGPLYGE